MNWIIYVLWGIIMVSLVIEIKYTKERLASLKRGFNALKFLPVALIILITAAIVAITAKDQFPILNWGWLGTNIMMQPLVDIAETQTTTVGIGVDLVQIITIILFMVAIAFACLLCNFYEEERFRSSLFAVVIWAFIHMLMGIPIYAVFPIFCVGLFYKYIYDKYSLDHSYCLHFFTNMSLVSVMGIVLIIGEFV
jgi:membrane protease YdiL (CAAX protease family)